MRAVRKLLCFFSLSAVLGAAHKTKASLPFEGSPGIFLEEKSFCFPAFPGAFNPSIFRVEEGFLVSFRYAPDPQSPYCNCVGLFIINEDLEVVVSPYLLDLRSNSSVPSQAEDARLFSYQGEIWILYNDNAKKRVTHYAQPRDMFLAKLVKKEGKYQVDCVQELSSEDHEPYNKQEKNWAPFVWQEALFVAYTLSPHEVLYVRETGTCEHYASTNTRIPWNWGEIRGSSSPQPQGDEYIALFHSRWWHEFSTPSKGQWYYFAGIYCFSASPPFAITKISAEPLLGEDFYPKSTSLKKVIFPGGLVLEREILYIAYGKNDQELWIAKLDWNLIHSSLRQIDGT